MTYVVTWGSGNLAVVEADGRITVGSDRQAIEAVQAALREPILHRFSEVDDAGSVTEWTRDLRPGDAGHVEAALRKLPASVVTQDG